MSNNYVEGVCGFMIRYSIFQMIILNYLRSFCQKEYFNEAAQKNIINYYYFYYHLYYIISDGTNLGIIMGRGIERGNIAR